MAVSIDNYRFFTTLKTTFITKGVCKVKNNFKKDKYTIWFYPSTSEKIDSNLKLANCSTRSEFLEKAIDFYTGYLHAESDQEYLGITIKNLLEGYINVLRRNTSEAFLRSSASTMFLAALIAPLCNTDPEELNDIYAWSVRKIKETNGVVDLSKVPHSSRGHDGTQQYKRGDTL